MKIESLKPYTFSEIFQLAKLSIGRRLVKSVPEELKSMNYFLGFLNYKGVIPQIVKDSIFFEYNINNTPFYIYLKTKSSDIDVFNQIILNNEYKSVVKIINKYNIPCTTMLDAGANIGLASIYFKSQFPKLNIIALEPSVTTFKRLERNINKLEGIRGLKKGIWSHSTYLSADTSFRDGRDWAFKLIETSQKVNDTFEVVSIFDVISEFKLDHIDVLKIDIEGGEESVFSVESNIDWLKKVRLIAIEIHDEFNCRDHIENMLLKFGFILSYSGELTIGINKNLLTEVLPISK
jgi:FkbM family methyltransferase